MAFDKFVWIKTLAADPDRRLAGSDKFILIYAAQVNVRFGEDTLCVRQATLAANCATTDRQVRRAFSAGKECGYLVFVQGRQRGRGHMRADEHRLAFPHGIPDSVSALNGEIPDSPSGIRAEIPDKTVENAGQNGHKYRTNSSEIADKANSSTSDTDPSKGFPKGFQKGSLQGFGQENNPSEKQQHAPDGAGLDEKKPRPQLPAMVHGLLKSTNPARAGNRPPPLKNDAVREEREPFVERIQGIAACELCDHFGDVLEELGDGEPVRCWHGKEPAPPTMKGTL